MVSAPSKLTTNSSETQAAGLFGNDSVFEIPFFQRPYKWTDARIKTLNEDLLDLVDDPTDLHFLGAIIIFGRQTDPSDPGAYEVIDGQQRITTVFLHLCAAIKTLLDNDLFDDAERMFRRYLVTNTRLGGKSNLKLQPSKEDRADLNNVIKEILDTKSFGERLQGFTFYKLSESDPKDGRIKKNFSSLKRFYREQAAQEAGVDRVKALYTALLQRTTFVQIVVEDPASGPDIFDSLNSRQEPMTIGDLVRNDVFNKVAREDFQHATELDQHDWQPFYEKFRTSSGTSLFDGYFFPFGLIANPNLRKTDTYKFLRTEWADNNPSQVISSLAEYQDNYLDLATGTNTCNHPKEVSLRISRLRNAKVPTSTYPFLMRLSKAIQNEEVGVEDGAAILDVLDSFLTRRAVCGYEPTGLHAVFKRLWTDSGDAVSSASVRKAISSHKTVVWPGDVEFQEKVKTRPLYGTGIVHYLLFEHNESLGGDAVDITHQVEHVLPLNPKAGEWRSFSSAEHDEFKNVLANLVPISSAMNNELKNRGYFVKRPVYESDSGFKAARDFSKTYEDWTPVNLQARAAYLADWCNQRWPYSSKGE
jgi:uncharacterized protein with ParB-like and HNH nuclease domain